MANIKRKEFSKKTKDTVSKRAGMLCSICGAITTGPSLESIVSIANVGVAAHISAALPRGARYNTRLTNEERCSISNAIWLCQNDAALIDRDSKYWTVTRLQDRKQAHEDDVRRKIGIGNEIGILSLHLPNNDPKDVISPVEYGIVTVGALVDAYKIFIAPIIQDKALENSSSMGVFMCENQKTKVKWTVFVNIDWLRWFINGHNSGFGTIELIPNEQIYGIVPSWPDTFNEFLIAIVKSNSTFEYKRQKGGYLALTQV